MAGVTTPPSAGEQMLTVDVMVAVFAMYIIIFMFFLSPGTAGNSAVIILLSIIAFLAYKLVAAAGFRFVRKGRPPEPPRTLLLLRVFGFARRSQRLFDDLGQRWRYLGPISLIAGTDLAYATIEPHEFYDFLSGRLSRAFVKDQEDLDSRLSKDTPVADPDGLFRIQDFYCHDDTWRMTVARLARDADAVFMDLRGFTASNCGCIWEIELLLHVRRLSGLRPAYDAGAGIGAILRSALSAGAHSIAINAFSVRQVVGANAAVRQGDVHRPVFGFRCACGLVQCSALPFVCDGGVLQSWYMRAQAE